MTRTATLYRSPAVGFFLLAAALATQAPPAAGQEPLLSPPLVSGGTGDAAISESTLADGGFLEDGAGSGTGRATEDCGPMDRTIRERDSWWLVSTRRVSCASFEPDDLEWWRRDEDGCWVPADWQSFREEPVAGPTVWYLHGNRENAGSARRRGHRIYQRLISKSDVPTLRYVIWSWPSARERGPIRDFRSKARRADTDAVLLGRVLAATCDRRHCLLGYSYGARIATGALHLLGGGTLLGHRTQPASDQVVPARAVLVAAAVHRHWLSPGGTHAECLTPCDRMLLLVNQCDPVLKRYGTIERCSRPQALGFSGAPRGLPVDGPLQERIVSGQVGRSHNEFDFYYSSRVRDLVSRELLEVDQPSPEAVSAGL